ncbi:TPA_asm: N [Tagetes erecta virus 1]|uniref:Nucleoprotein n=1 Tax=Tagetes erecta virus 1 TaxID=2793742 RepID=A0A8D9PH37_9RHAB|nr:N [Tagetes erecta virus 1] [Tagetes erecta virus 1]DAF42346.1 TPA_asm: N [Tagetes erecta virus 1]
MFDGIYNSSDEGEKEKKIDIFVNEKFNEAKKIPFSNTGARQVWKNSYISDAQGYKIPNNLDEGQLDLLLTQLKNSMSKNLMTGDECYMILIGASYLRSVESKTEKRLLKESNFGSEEIPWSVVMTEGAPEETLPPRLYTPVGLEDLTQAERESLDAYSMDILESQQEIERVVKSDGFELLPLKVQTEWMERRVEILTKSQQILEVLQQESMRARAKGKSKESISKIKSTLSPVNRKYGLFICAFLFKGLSKAAKNLQNSWVHKSQRFQNFYPGVERPDEWKTPEIPWLEEIRKQFNQDRKALLTALRMINTLEIRLIKEQTADLGLIRYLWCVPLSYTGMHAYKLFCTSREYLKKDVNWLLSQLTHPIFNDSLDEIFDLHQHYEDDGTEGFNPAFRYARIFGSQYFTAIQTKQCTALVYCLGQIIKWFEGENSTFDPENIANVDKLSENLKFRMKLIVENIILACNQEDAKSSAQAVTMALKSNIKWNALSNENDVNDNTTPGPTIPRGSEVRTIEDLMN